MKTSKFEISLVMAGIACIILALATSQCSYNQRAHAERQASTWAKQMGLTVQGVSCADADSDGDGYVSCTIATPSKDGSVALHPVECASSLSRNSGCRVPKAIVRQGS